VATFLSLAVFDAFSESGLVFAPCYLVLERGYFFAVSLSISYLLPLNGPHVFSWFVADHFSFGLGIPHIKYVPPRSPCSSPAPPAPSCWATLCLRHVTRVFPFCVRFGLFFLLTPANALPIASDHCLPCFRGTGRFFVWCLVLSPPLWPVLGFFSLFLRWPVFFFLPMLTCSGDRRRSFRSSLVFCVIHLGSVVIVGGAVLSSLCCGLYPNLKTFFSSGSPHFGPRSFPNIPFFDWSPDCG